jgi:hypothetical protein
MHSGRLMGQGRQLAQCAAHNAINAPTHICSQTPAASAHPAQFTLTVGRTELCAKRRARSASAVHTCGLFGGSDGCADLAAWLSDVGLDCTSLFVECSGQCAFHSSEKTGGSSPASTAHGTCIL